MSGSYFGQSTSSSDHLGDIQCLGREDNILNCSNSLVTSCPSHNVASVVCQCKKMFSYFAVMTVLHSFCSLLASTTLPGGCGCTEGDLRLGDGRYNVTTGVVEGRLEICINEAWGSVCNNYFGSAESSVVCRFFNLTEGGEILILIVKSLVSTESLIMCC